MDLVTIGNMFADYGGVVIGVALLLLGTMVLPSALRKYVLTAGLAIAAFRVMQIACSGKRLAKADAERARLQDELKKHSVEREAFIKKQEALNGQLIKVKQDLSMLDTQSKDLESSAAATAETKTKLDREVQEMQARHEKLLQETQANEKILALFENAEAAIQDLERVQ
jgi:uncharacterized protein (DUF3084 family)